MCQTRAESRAGPCSRNRRIFLSTLLKSNFPSWGSIWSQKMGNSIVFALSALNLGAARSMRSGKPVLLPTCPPRMMNGLPSTMNCVTAPRFSKCGSDDGTFWASDAVAASEPITMQHNSIRNFISVPFDCLVCFPLALGEGVGEGLEKTLNQGVIPNSNSCICLSRRCK